MTKNSGRIMKSSEHDVNAFSPDNLRSKLKKPKKSAWQPSYWLNLAIVNHEHESALFWNSQSMPRTAAINQSIRTEWAIRNFFPLKSEADTGSRGFITSTTFR